MKRKQLPNKSELLSSGSCGAMNDLNRILGDDPLTSPEISFRITTRTPEGEVIRFFKWTLAVHHISEAA